MKAPWPWRDMKAVCTVLYSLVHLFQYFHPFPIVRSIFRHEMDHLHFFHFSQMLTAGQDHKSTVSGSTLAIQDQQISRSGRACMTYDDAEPNNMAQQ